MAKLTRIVRLLHEQRRQVQDQLDAIDRAIAALEMGGMAVAQPGRAEPVAPAEEVAGTVLPRQVKTRRVLSDSHKQALLTGKRKARAAHDVAKGLVREMPDDAFVPAIGSRHTHQPPRLVKRAVRR